MGRHINGFDGVRGGYGIDEFRKKNVARVLSEERILHVKYMV